jgi:hypothetical protein
VKNMNKSTTYAIVAVVIIIIVVAGVAIWYYYGNGTGNNEVTPTPTPPPSGVADATTVSFNASVTAGGTTTMYMWQGKNIHADTVTFRVDLEGGYAYILNAGTQTAWESTDSGATWTAGDFPTDWLAWGATWQDYLDNLTHWNGMDSTYSIDDATIGSAVVSNIVINPTIPAATFNET